MSRAPRPPEPRPLPAWILWVYPKRYRRSHGPELTAIYLESVAGLGRVSVMRERADLLGHAVRVRLGISAAQPHGALLATANPYMLASLCAFGIVELFESWASRRALSGLAVPAASGLGPGQQCAFLLYALLVAAFGLGISGRRAAARATLTAAFAVQALLAVLSVVEFAGRFPHYGLLRSCYEGPHAYEGGILLLVLLGLPVLAAPPEPLDRRRFSRRACAMLIAGIVLPSAAITCLTWQAVKSGIHPGSAASSIADAYFQLFAWSGPAGLVAPLALSALLPVAIRRRETSRLEAGAIALTGGAWLMVWGIGPLHWTIFAAGITVIPLAARGCGRLAERGSGALDPLSRH